MIEFKDIYQKYKGRELFGGLNLFIEKGEKVVLSGSSGSGKSTLLAFAMGFLLPDKGTIVINDLHLNAKNIDEIRYLMAWLPQNTTFAGEGIVREAIMKPFSFRLNKSVTPSEKTIRSGLEKIGLEQDILDSKFDDISGGEKQRIGILTCSLLNRPIMILDEPTSALDEMSIALVTDFILSAPDRTVLSTSHENLWVNACDKIVKVGPNGGENGIN